MRPPARTRSLLFAGLMLIATVHGGATATARADDDPVRFAVIGDYGAGTAAEADVAALVDDWEVDFVATVGDNNYPTGEAHTIDEHIGRYYADYIFPYRGSYGPGSPDRNRFWPAMGNHDGMSVECSCGACAGPYFDYFDLPGNERYYDVREGPVHLFVVNSDAGEPDGTYHDSIQAEWLRAGLAASDAPHRLVLLHHAPFSSSTHHGPTPRVQWPFEEWGATAVLAGHDHHYERLQVGGIPYFVNGSGGRNLNPVGDPLPQTQVAFDSDFGAMVVDAESDHITYRFLTRDAEVVDSHTVSAGEAGQGLTVRRQVLAPTDDAEERGSGWVNRFSSDLELVDDTHLGAPGQTLGLRFTDLHVPRGATIVEAQVEFTVDERSSGPAELVIAGEAVDDAASFAAARHSISQRPRTDAEVAWTPADWREAGRVHHTTDLTAVVQEIVERPGWSSGNALALLVTGTGRRVAESADGADGAAPTLVLHYLPPPAHGAGSAFDSAQAEDGGDHYVGRVASAQDDAEESLEDGTVSLSSTDLELTEEASPQIVGMRFCHVDIPPGATVTAAHLELTADESDDVATELLLQGQASDHAPVFAAVDGDLSTRDLTQAAVAWRDLDPWSVGETHTSPDLRTVVQEIVDRPGWRAGNAIVVMATGSGRRTAESYDGDRSSAPALRIDYEVPEVSAAAEVGIALGRDDAEEQPDGSINRWSSDLELVTEASNQTVGLRFDGLDVPHGAAITHAEVQFVVDEPTAEATSLTLQAEAADHAGPLTTRAFGLSSRPRTSAAVTWEPAPWLVAGSAGAPQRTPDLAPLLQELVDRPGWREGNALLLLVTGSGSRVAVSANGDPAAAPSLRVTYR